MGISHGGLEPRYIGTKLNLEVENLVFLPLELAALRTDPVPFCSIANAILLAEFLKERVHHAPLLLVPLQQWEHAALARCALSLPLQAAKLPEGLSEV